MEIVVKIFGSEPPCKKCKSAEKAALDVQREIEWLKVEKYSALSEEGDKYGVMMTPTVVVNNKVVSVGKAISKKELEQIIRSEMEGTQ